MGEVSFDLSLGDLQHSRNFLTRSLVAQSQKKNRTRQRRERRQDAVESLLKNSLVQLELGCPLVDQHVFLDRSLQVLGRMACAPLSDDMARDADQVRFGVAYVAKVTGAEEPKIRLLRQVFDVDRQPNPPPEKSKQISVPSSPPARNEVIV